MMKVQVSNLYRLMSRLILKFVLHQKYKNKAIFTDGFILASLTLLKL
jgi:hypothetical protein